MCLTFAAHVQDYTARGAAGPLTRRIQVLMMVINLITGLLQIYESDRIDGIPFALHSR